MSGDEVIMRPSRRSTGRNWRYVVVVRLIGDDQNMDVETITLSYHQHLKALPPGPGMNKWIFKHKGVAYMGDVEDFELVSALEILAGLEKIKDAPKS